MIHGALTITLKMVRPLSHITKGFPGLIIQLPINLLMKSTNIDSLINFIRKKLHLSPKSVD
jgi:hypothetical protein